MVGVRRRLRKRRQGREMGEKGLKVVRKEVIVRTGMDILDCFGGGAKSGGNGSGLVVSAHVS